MYIGHNDMRGRRATAISQSLVQAGSIFGYILVDRGGGLGVGVACATAWAPAENDEVREGGGGVDTGGGEFMAYKRARNV